LLALPLATFLELKMPPIKEEDDKKNIQIMQLN
jgi:hypothetical protein